MKRYLLDTALVAAFLHGRPKAVELITPLVKRDEAATSILVYGEVIEYLKGLPTFGEYKAKLQQLFRLKQITPYPLVFDSRKHYQPLKTANRISLPESKKVLIEISSHLTYFVQLLIENGIILTFGESSSIMWNETCV